MQPKQEKRPVFLTIIGILSLISIILALQGNLVAWFTGPSSESEMMDQRVALAELETAFEDMGAEGITELTDSMTAILEQTNENFFLANGINTIGSLCGLFGVLMMFRRRRLGFHLYIIYCLVATGGIFLYVRAADVPVLLTVSNLIMSAVFILMYGLNLKWMNR